MLSILSKLGRLSFAMAMVACTSEGGVRWSCDDFGEDGMVALDQFTSDIATTADGKVLALGTLPRRIHPNAPLSVMRLSADGSRDPEFADGGDYILERAGESGGIEVDDDGRAVFMGYDRWPTGVVGRLLQDGSLDSSFGMQGVAELTGWFAYVGDRVLGMNDATITMLGLDGILEPTFGVGGSVDVPVSAYYWDAGVQADAEIILNGSREDGSHVLMRLDANGTLDLSFGSGGLVDFHLGGSMTLDTEDRILANGCPSGCSVPALSRLTADGEIDTSFGDDGTLRGYGGIIEVLPDGRILLVSENVTRLLPDGGIDVSFGEQGTLTGLFENTAARYAAVAPDGRIYVAFAHHSDEVDTPPDEATLICIKPEGR